MSLIFRRQPFKHQPIGSFAALSLFCCLLARPGVLLAQEFPIPPPIREFAKQILQPAATLLANEEITQLKYQIAYQYAKNERMMLEKGKGDPDTSFYRMFDFPASGPGLVPDGLGKDSQENAGRVREARHKEFIAWLDTRRIPLKEEILDLWVKKVIVKDRSYIACVDSKWRQYIFESGRFYRLDVAPTAIAESCDRLDLKMMKSLKWRE
jgi:hypothetical protein